MPTLRLPLTIKREKWVKQFKPTAVMQGAPLQYNAAIQLRYAKEIMALVRQMTQQTERELKQYFKTGKVEDYFAQDSLGEDAKITPSAKSLTNALMKKFNNLFANKAPKLAVNMVDETNKTVSSNLQASLKQLSGGLTLNTKVMTDQFGDILASSITENVGLIKNISAEYMTQVQGAVMRSISTGGGLPGLIEFLKKQEGITVRRATNIAFDQTRKCYSNLAAERMKKIGVQKYTWRHSSGGQEPRQLHKHLDGKVFSFDDPPVIQYAKGSQPEVRGKPGDLINCFPGTTQVSLANGCKNLWRYWYDGTMVNLVVSGQSLDCTPNHPILTIRGWIPAHEIQEGDYLASSKLDNLGGVDGKINEIVPSFDDLFIASIGTGCAKTSPSSEFNFHGDIPENDVDGIVTNYKLADGVEAISCEEIEKLVLSLSDSSSLNSSTCIFPEVVNASGASSFGEGDSFIDGKSSHSQTIGLASVTQNDSCITQNSGDNISGAAILGGELQNACSVIVGFDDYLTGGINLGDSICGRNDITGFFQSSRKPATTTPVDFRELTGGHSAINGLLRVEKKTVSIFSGHVYTMESELGWYSVTPANIISKNCRCFMVPVISFDEGKVDD
jgi:SPP1 gp7 family putative phage head morphogenesis protein